MSKINKSKTKYDEAPEIERRKLAGMSKFQSWFINSIIRRSKYNTRRCNTKLSDTISTTTHSSSFAVTADLLLLIMSSALTASNQPNSTHKYCVQQTLMRCEAQLAWQLCPFFGGQYWVGETDLVFQDYKSPCAAAVRICATLVNIQTDTHRQTHSILTSFYETLTSGANNCL